EVELINASVNRMNMRMLIPYYIAELARYRPDVVIVFGTYNDAYWVDHEGGADRYHYRPEAPTPEEERVELLLNGTSVRAAAEKIVRVAVNRSALAAGAYRLLDRVFETLHARGLARLGDTATATDATQAP